MTAIRFTWQRQKVGETTGIVLNIGCQTDPGNIKLSFGDRVQNVDLYDVDPSTGDANMVDRLFDITKTWPIPDDYAEMALFGDILEHLTVDEMRFALTEARRVAEKLAITVPNDPRVGTDELLWKMVGGERVQVPADEFARGMIHITKVEGDLLREVIESTGWSIREWNTVDYDVVAPEGFFVLAERA